MYGSKNCDCYIKTNKILSALQRNEQSLRDEIKHCLDTIYRKPFLNKIFLPFLLASPDEIIQVAEESFTRAVSVLLEHIAGSGKAQQYSSVEQPLFTFFKLGYHKQLGLLLRIPDATAQVSFLLLQTNIFYRDYLVWHYVNNFNVRQISVITGKQANEVKSNLWHSREHVRNWMAKTGEISTNESISVQQFYNFLDYFTDETTVERSVPPDKLVIDNPFSVQKNFELELLFRYHIDKTILQKNLSNKTDEPYVTAEEYLDQIKQIIFSDKHNRPQSRKLH